MFSFNNKHSTEEHEKLNQICNQPHNVHSHINNNSSIEIISNSDENDNIDEQ